SEANRGGGEEKRKSKRERLSRLIWKSGGNQKSEEQAISENKPFSKYWPVNCRKIELASRPGFEQRPKVVSDRESENRRCHANVTRSVGKRGKLGTKVEKQRRSWLTAFRQKLLIFFG